MALPMRSLQRMGRALYRRKIDKTGSGYKRVNNSLPALNRSNYRYNTNNSRPFWSRSVGTSASSAKWLVGGVVVGAAVLGASQIIGAEEKKADWDAIRKEIIAILEKDPHYDDGSYGPVLVRLAWHASGTYDKETKTGGSNGATMRFNPEAGHDANAGLHVARNLLEPIKKKHPEISYADLWTFAGVVAVEEMHGPKISWRPGRKDVADDKHCPPDGRLPDAVKGADHIRAIFYRMGFDDQEIVALAGAHALGRCHADRSGFLGPWTRSPTTFSNDFFVQLSEQKWTPKKWNGPKQFEDPTGELMMLPADIAFIEDPRFKKHVEQYANDEDLFFKDFAKAFGKLLELGVPFEEEKVWWQKLFPFTK